MGLYVLKKWSMTKASLKTLLSLWGSTFTL